MNKKTILVILAIAIAIGAVISTFCSIKHFLNEDDTLQKIGGDKDKHGCMIAAGYSWCEKKQKCIRPWEEVCDPKASINTLSDLIIRLKAYNKEKSGISFLSGTTTLSWRDKDNIIEIKGESLSVEKIGKEENDNVTNFFKSNNFEVDQYNISDGTVVGLIGYKKGNLVCTVISGASGYKKATGQWIPLEKDGSDVDIKCGILTSIIPPLPTEVVEIYMKHTLGSIPNSNIDYDKAKKYLSSELKKKFTDSMFVPTSYCIQDGPTDVKIISDEVDASSISIVVSALYGSEWKNMWKFSLSPDKASDSNYWLIKEIECLSD